MFGWGVDSEDEFCSRFVFDIVIWPQEVTLVRWTQLSGPLCLWQCLILSIVNRCYRHSPVTKAHLTLQPDLWTLRSVLKWSFTSLLLLLISGREDLGWRPITRRWFTLPQAFSIKVVPSRSTIVRWSKRQWGWYSTLNALNFSDMICPSCTRSVSHFS